MKRTVISLACAIAILSGPAASAADAASRAAIDRALVTLLADYDVQDHLDIRRNEELATGFYEVRPGDTLDGIINRAIQGSSIRKDMLRSAFIRANPHAFPSSNPNRMLSGVRLRIPTADDVIRLVFTVDPATLELARRVRQRWVRFPCYAAMVRACLVQRIFLSFSVYR